MKLGQRVAGLEQKLSRGGHDRRSERVIANREAHPPPMARSRSLEMLDANENENAMQATRYVCFLICNIVKLLLWRRQVT